MSSAICRLASRVFPRVSQPLQRLRFRQGPGVLSALPSADSTSVSNINIARTYHVLSARNFKKVNNRCGCCAVHTDGDKELCQFLAEEIKFEQEEHTKGGGTPSVGEFRVEGNGAEVTLTRDLGGEKISINFNVNHSVDATEDNDASEEPAKMVSRPAFTVTLAKGPKTLVLDCQHSQADEQQGETQEVFDITEAWLQQGDLKDTTYIMSAENMDGNMYDILVNMLCDRGVDDAFVTQMSSFATWYEHVEYIKFLEKLKDFSDN